MAIDTTDIDGLALFDFGQSITLSLKLIQKQVLGIVNHNIDPVRFLAQGRSVPSCIVQIAYVDATALTPEWIVTIGTERRAIIEIVNDYSGMIEVYLGDVI